MKRWKPEFRQCSGCDVVARSSYGLVTIRYAGEGPMLCLGQGDQPKASCLRKFLVRVRVCLGCSKGSLVDGKYAHKVHNRYDPDGVPFGRLCPTCEDAILRGREATRSDKRDRKASKERGEKVWILHWRHHKGYVSVLAEALAGGGHWPANAPSAPSKATAVRDSGSDYPDDGDFKLASAQLDPQAVWKLKLAIDRLVVIAKREGYRQGRNLLQALSDGRYTSSEFDESQDRSEADFERRLEELDELEAGA